MVSTRSGELCFLSEDNFLSNCFLADIRLNNIIYKSAEHLYQEARCFKQADREKIHNASNGKTAKIYGKFASQRPGWDKMKVVLMERILRLKFKKRTKLSRLLLETGDLKLVHLNHWHDTFWGSCACSQHRRTGKNMLGELLMKIRAEQMIIE